ncbi:hypothetical protein CONPUDRAFT_37153, partial [Coniophora puteana RWD-64-598 SS2]
LRWVPRTSTCAAQKTPDDAEQQIYELFLRLALTLRDSGIRHSDLVVNFDQTQVVMSDHNTRTFDVQGSRQVDVVGKDEKRAFTAVVGISASGTPLPTQFIYKGATERSVPSSRSPLRDEASCLGFVYSWNPRNYWSDLASMEQYFECIIAPYFEEQKRRLNYEDDQECAVLLDCWSVHRGRPFCDLVHTRWPWIRLHYIPGGTT